MANFYPFKAYIIQTLDELIQKHSIRGPFLDVGCGSGDVALHLAKLGWCGEAIDVSPQAIKVANQNLEIYPSVNVLHKEIHDYNNEHFRLIMFLDVLEHISDDMEVIKSAANLEYPGDYLILTIPSNPETEWRWDDEFYGHLRRYNLGDINSLLKFCGYQIIELMDISYPIFWILRRAFTILKKPPRTSGDAWQRTLQSPFANAWELGWISKILSHPFIWTPLFKIQNKGRDQINRGNELMILAKRV